MMECFLHLNRYQYVKPIIIQVWKKAYFKEFHILHTFPDDETLWFLRGYLTHSTADTPHQSVYLEINSTWVELDLFRADNMRWQCSRPQSPDMAKETESESEMLLLLLFNMWTCAVREAGVWWGYASRWWTLRRWMLCSGSRVHWIALEGSRHPPKHTNT